MNKICRLSIPQELLNKPQALFALALSPTRELAIQIAEQFEALGASIGVKCAVLVGGIDMMAQVHSRVCLAIELMSFAAKPAPAEPNSPAVLVEQITLMVWLWIATTSAQVSRQSINIWGAGHCTWQAATHYRWYTWAGGGSSLQHKGEYLQCWPRCYRLRS